MKKLILASLLGLVATTSIAADTVTAFLVVESRDGLLRNSCTYFANVNESKKYITISVYGRRCKTKLIYQPSSGVMQSLTGEYEARARVISKNTI